MGQVWTVVVALALGAALGFGAGARRRGAAGSRKGAGRWGTAGDRRAMPGDQAELDDYLGRMEEFSQAVPPVWASHVDSCRQQLDTAVTELAARLSGAVRLLETALESPRFGAGSTGQALSENIFASSRTSLDDVVHTLDSALNHKRQILEQLQGLVSLNDDMKSMTAEVSRIAAQTHLLALNAAIEASRVGEAGAAFAVVAVEVRQLADLSGSTAKRIGMRAEEVGAAIALTFNAAEATALDEGTAVSDANSKVQLVLDDVMQLQLSLRDCADQFGTAAVGVREEISASLGQFTFQDRIGQSLHNLRSSVLLLPTLLAYVPQQNGPGGRPVDSAAVLASLAGGPAPADSSAESA